MTVTIPPVEAQRMMRERNAMLIDVRSPYEYARERIPGAINLPLARLETPLPVSTDGRPLLVHCRSGARTAAQAARLAARFGDAVGVLEGGLDAWVTAGLPVTRDMRQPMELMRQVQITAGSMVLAGVLLGWLIAPGFFVLAGFVGAGLVFAGLSGTCGLAHLLRRMPWNRRLAAP